jgi:hypothetical protein
LKSIRCDVFATIEPSGERCPGCCSAGIWQTQPHIPWAKPLGGAQREYVTRLHDPTWPAGMMGRRLAPCFAAASIASMLVQPRGQPITTMGARGGVDRSLRPSSNRQRCDRDYKSCEERAHAEERQDIVHFGHGIPPLRIGERDGGAKATLLQSFADNGVRPALKGRIKSNQI